MRTKSSKWGWLYQRLDQLELNLAEGFISEWAHVEFPELIELLRARSNLWGRADTQQRKKAPYLIWSIETVSKKTNSGKWSLSFRKVLCRPSRHMNFDLARLKKEQEWLKSKSVS